MPFALAAAPAAAAAGPFAPLVLGGLGVGSLLAMLFGRGGKDNPAPPTAKNPITGMDVPKNPDGSYWGIDPQTGLPGQLIEQIWGAKGPEGLPDLAGMSPEQFIQGRLPFWANNRLQDISTKLGGWDKFVDWSMKPENWTQIMTVLGQPWGQGEYDKLPAGYTPDMGAAQPPPQVNEGQTSTNPQDPTTGANGDPTFTTDVYGRSIPLGGLTLGAAGLGAGLAGLSGMGQGSSSTTTPGTPGGTTPNYETTGWDVGDLTPGAANARALTPDFSVTGWGTPDPTFGVTGFGSTPTLGGTSFQTGPLVSTPGGRGFPVSIFPKLNEILGGLPTVIGGGGGGNSKPPGQQQPGQQPGQQRPGSLGEMLLPFFAASIPQGVTSTPAPYASLPPQTPVGPVFQPQGRPKRVPSIGELLGGFGG